LDNSFVNPYDPNPQVQVDFSAILNQDPWFQAVGGGIMAKNTVADMIPITHSNAPLDLVLMKRPAGFLHQLG